MFGCTEHELRIHVALALIGRAAALDGFIISHSRWLSLVFIATSLLPSRRRQRRQRRRRQLRLPHYINWILTCWKLVDGDKYEKKKT